MQNTNMIEENKLWLYDTFRSIAEKSTESANAASGLINDFSDKRFYNPDDLSSITVFKNKDFVAEKVSCLCLSKYDDMAYKLYREGVALAHIFGNERLVGVMSEELRGELDKFGISVDPTFVEKWGGMRKSKGRAEIAFDEISGKQYIYAAFEIIKVQSLVKFLHDSGKISDEKYDLLLDNLMEGMDRIGLNGIDRMLKARPELKDVFAQDNRQIILNHDLTKDAASSFSISDDPIPEYAQVLLSNPEFISRGTYYTLMNENVYKTPLSKQTLIYNMLTKEYIDAFDDRAKTFRSHSLHARDDIDLNLDYNSMIMKINSPQNMQEFGKAYKSYIINYKIGLQHDKFEDICEQLVGNKFSAKDDNIPDPTVIESRQLLDAPIDLEDTQKKSLGLVGSTNSEGGQVESLEGGSGDSNGALNGSQSPTPTTSNNDPAADNNVTPPDTSGDPPDTGVVGTPVNAQTTPPVGSDDDKQKPVSNQPLVSNSGNSNTNNDGDKYKGFVTSGKLATTAVLGIGLVDGVKRVMNKDAESTQEDKSQDNKKLFIGAVEVVAALTGIVLVWKSQKVHEALNNLAKNIFK